MIKNYLKTAWRNIKRNKANSFINIAGLAIGMTCVILILLYVQDELKYDRFLKQADRLYQVNLTSIDNGTEFQTGNTAPAVGPSLVADFPEIASYARIYRPGDVLVRYEEEKHAVNFFTEKQLMAVDSDFLQVFSYEMIEGDAAGCLQKPNSLVITEQTAKKYFGNSNAIGKVLLFNNEKTAFTVTAVLHNILSQSSFQFDMLVPISTYGEVKKRSWNWNWLQVSTYIKLKDNVATDKAGIAKLEAKFPAMVKKNAFKSHGQSYDEFIKKGGKMEYHLQSFTSVHLYANGMNTTARLTTLGDIKYIRIFSLIAIFIIILACVNFMNLSTAQSARRAKEVGIRKVLGSEKKQLIRQFLTEAILYSLLSAIIAIIMVLLLLKPFNEIAGKSFDVSIFFNTFIWLFLAGLILITGLLAGSYPAFYLTSFQPVAVLKGLKLFQSGLGNLFIRNGLVVFQFTVSTALIICTIIVFKQLQFTRERDLGLNKENIVVIANGSRLGDNKESFRQELTRLPGVVSASISSSIPSKVNFEDTYVPEPGSAKEDLIKEIGIPSFVVDDDFVSTLQIKIVKGRNFSRDFMDSASVILNETAVKQIGWKDPVGQYLQYPGNSQRFKVVGVVKDFNIESLRDIITRFALFHHSSKTYDLGKYYISVKLKPGNTNDHLHQLESKWKTFASSVPFDYSFLDSDLDALYRAEQRMGNLFGVFSFLSIFVACLGLFGLAAYTAERRTKEIGVRKVLGASVHGVVLLLSRDFVKLVAISVIIAFPVAGWAMHQWLADFAYRTNMGWWIFLVAGAMSLFIALLTVSFQAIKAAVANPVNSLRSE